jgi:hypothetical protein
MAVPFVNAALQEDAELRDEQTRRFEAVLAQDRAAVSVFWRSYVALASVEL